MALISGTKLREKKQYFACFRDFRSFAFFTNFETVRVISQEPLIRLGLYFDTSLSLIVPII